MSQCLHYNLHTLYVLYITPVSAVFTAAWLAKAVHGSHLHIEHHSTHE